MCYLHFSGLSTTVRITFTVTKNLLVSRYSNTETNLTMSTLATWSHVVQSRDVAPLQQRFHTGTK